MNTNCHGLHPRIPTGFHPPAQGCEARATLGCRPAIHHNPERRCARVGANHMTMTTALHRRSRWHNPFGIGFGVRPLPRVAHSSQPWAPLHNPVGIEHGSAASPKAIPSSSRVSNRRIPTGFHPPAQQRDTSYPGLAVRQFSTTLKGVVAVLSPRRGL